MKNTSKYWVSYVIVPNEYTPHPLPGARPVTVDSYITPTPEYFKQILLREYNLDILTILSWNKYDE